jgi:signal peptidase I
VNVQGTRRIGPIRAFLAGFFGLGLGYVYVGDLRLAFASIFGTLGVLAIFSWTRLIVVSALAYWICAGIIITVTLTALIHPVIVTVRFRERPRRAFNRAWFYYLWAVGVGTGSFFIIVNRVDVFGYGTFRTASASMLPTLEKDDYFMANTWRYKTRDPADGELVILEKPGEAGVTYIKRVVGVAGDLIEIQDGVLYRNGHAVVEPYIHAPTEGFGYGRDYPATPVLAGEAFVLGDFRDNSIDSRRWGAVPIKSLRGRAEYIWYSTAAGGVQWQRIGMSLRP